MNKPADGFHEEGSDQVATDGSEWLDFEKKDEHRCHEGAATHAGQANSETGD
jgi:hypothetical protein